MQEAASPATLEDHLSGYRAGDAAAFNAVYESTKGVIYNYIRRRVASEAEADDAFQDTYLRLHRYIATYDPTKGGMGWIIAIARHVLYARRLAKGSSSPSFDATVAELPSDATSPATAAELENTLQALCGDLSPVDAELFLRRTFTEESFDALGTRLHLTPQNARQRFSRILRKFRAEWST